MTTALKNLLPTIFPKKDEWKYHLLRIWPEIIGDLGTKVRIEKILDETIVLGVLNSCWLQELYALSPVFIKMININLDKPRIKQVRFKKAGALKNNCRTRKKTRRQDTPNNIPLTTQQKHALARLKDPQLAHTLEQFLKHCHGEK